jgi:putative transposase
MLRALRDTFFTVNQDGIAIVSFSALENNVQECSA